MKLRKVLERDTGLSAVWAITDIPGLGVSKVYASASGNRGRWIVYLRQGEISAQAVRISDELLTQFFPTREEALQAVEAAAEVFSEAS